MPVADRAPSDPRPLLDALRAFAIPGGEAAARGVRAVRIREQGEIRAGPAAPWLPFTAEKTLEATRSGLRWNARVRTGWLKLVHVTDAYAEGHGELVVKLGGIVPVSRASGADLDEGELQRYLGELAQCPPALFQHRSLEWSAAGPRTLRVRDRAAPSDATVDLELGEDGRLLCCRAERPRMVGKRAVRTPFVGTASEVKEWAGLRIPSRLEATWLLAEGPLTYFRGEVMSLAIVR